MKDLSDEEVKSLTTAIKNRYDLDFTCYEIKSLKRRMSRALSVFGLQHIHELWAKVLKEQGFIHQLVNELSVGLTSMFRDPKLWIKLKTQVPEMLTKKETLKVWHAGCSSGEEVYTFNIVLEELGLRQRVRSVASDMNSEALDLARNGRYHMLKLDDYEKAYTIYNKGRSLRSYYTVAHDYGTMESSLIDNVRFANNNLITETIGEKFDIIFCRNVMIYFDQIAKKRVLDKFYESLRPGGLLIIGFFDSLVTVIDKEQFQFFDLDHKIFKKQIHNPTHAMDAITKKKLNLLVHLANIDGDFHKSERSLIDSLIRKKGLDPEDFYLLVDDRAHENLEDIDDKPELLYLALKLIKADGEVKPEEVSFCEKLAKKLGYNASLVNFYTFKELPSRLIFDEELRKTYKIT